MARVAVPVRGDNWHEELAAASVVVSMRGRAPHALPPRKIWRALIRFPAPGRRRVAERAACGWRPGAWIWLGRRGPGGRRRGTGRDMAGTVRTPAGSFYTHDGTTRDCSRRGAKASVPVCRCWPVCLHVLIRHTRRDSFRPKD
jgi:hypothetical protein